MKAAVAADPEMSLVVSADKEVMHGNVVHILDLAKLAGITKFAINVQQTESESLASGAPSSSPRRCTWGWRRA